jgi:hypothetical protein
VYRLINQKSKFGPRDVGASQTDIQSEVRESALT